MPARKNKKAKKIAKKPTATRPSKRPATSSRAQKKKPSKAKRAAAKPKRANTAKSTRPQKPKARAAAKKARPTAKKRPAAKSAAKRPAKGKLTPAQLKKLRERERAEKLRERERAARERERARLQKERERERAARDKERERLQKERERERETARRDKERARQLKEREREKARLAKEKAQERSRKEAERVAAKKAREVERQRQREEARRAKEEERAAREAERERQREEARRIKEAERAAREAEREAYRKAKEAERERLRAEKEAARRALEGRVARATKRAQRAGSGRSGAGRVYRPDAIPNQSGTTRRLGPGELAPPPPPARPLPPTPPTAPPPPEKPPVPDTFEERYSQVVERLGKAEDEFRNEYAESFDMSWIYHDSALEGVVYTYQELKTAIDPTVTVVADSSLQPVCEEIRRHKQALELTRELGEKKRVPLTVDTIKKIFLTLHPEEGDLKSVKYRKDIPQHRLYFHEYAAPDKIAYKVRQVTDWLNGPEPKKIKSPVRIAARVHYDLLRVFPFSADSGKVARLLMNVVLLRSGLPPAIIHSTERQRYYEALKSSLPTLVTMVNEAINNGLASIEKRLDEHESRVRPFGQA
jgi:DNA repair exonuclease SbcCD ATPase subunit